MNDPNDLWIKGNLVRDPEKRNLSSGTSLCAFTIATNRWYKKADGETTKETSFFVVEAWAKTADFCISSFTKGSSVLINGRLKQDTWEQNGEKRSTVKIIAEQVMPLTRPKPKEDGDGPFREDLDEPFDDRIPF